MAIVATGAPLGAAAAVDPQGAEAYGTEAYGAEVGRSGDPVLEFLAARGLVAGPGAQPVSADPVMAEDVVEPTPVLTVSAAAAPEAPDFALAANAAVDDDVLEGMRGGFEMPGGLKLSFGIERIVYINGELATSMQLNLPALGSTSGAGSGSGSLPTGQTVALIQNGPNNLFLADLPTSAALATVIQNSLDNQTIQTITNIDIQVNSLELLRAHRLGEALRDPLNLGR